MNAMKIGKFLLPALLLTAGGGCSKDTADEELRTQRKALLTAETPGVYRNGKPVFLFDRESHQLLADPSQCLFRIQDDEGRQYVSLRLEAMPAEGEKSAATISENMELGLGDAGDMASVGSDGAYLRLWSDQTRIGFVFPRVMP